mgnify:CR=1 FL=1
MARLDGSSPTRPLRMSYRHVTGKLALADGGAATYESTLERDWLLILDFDPCVTSVLVQPFTLNYALDGQTRRYTPDVKATFDDGSTVVFEVKPRETLRSDWTLLRPRFKAAHLYCRQQGWKFRVVNEQHIRTTYLSNARFLRRFRDLPSDPVIEATLLRSLLALGETSVQTLLVSAYWSEENRAAAVPYLWKLVATHQIGMAPMAPLTMHSIIWSGVG